MIFYQSKFSYILSYFLFLVRFQIHYCENSSNSFLIYDTTDCLHSAQINTSTGKKTCLQLFFVPNVYLSIDNQITYIAFLFFHLQKDYTNLNYKQILYMYKTLLFTTLVLIVSSQQIYQKVLLSDKSALCLDGSPGVYYIYKGDSAKVLLFFEGGGWCGDNDFSSTIQNCYQRSKTDLGSSTKYLQAVSFKDGILSDDSMNFFRNWTRVFLKYCDGSGHQGTRTSPVLYKGSQIYFRGQNVTLAQFNSVDKQVGIFSSKVTQLVISGQSAGGLAAFHWTNYLQNKVAPTTKFWSIPDSGVFLDSTNILTKVNSYRIWFQNLLKYSNQEIGTPNTECNQANKNQLWKCMFAQYLIDYITAPVFAPQSLYDSWCLYNILGIRCMDGSSLAECNKADRDSIEEYHRGALEVMFRIASSNKNGVWAPVCINHCYLTNSYYASPNYRIPSGSEFSLIQSVADWMQGVDSSSRHIDFGDWPLNSPCSGVTLQAE